MAIDEALSGTIAKRARVGYPLWLTFAAIAVFAVQAAKIPSLNTWALQRISADPEMQRGLSEEMLRTSIYTGVGVALLFSAVISCLALFSVAKFVHRRASDKARAFDRRNGALLYVFTFALLWPDVWAAFGVIQPLVLPLFWVSHLALASVIAWRTRDGRPAARHFGWCLGISLLGVLL